MFLERVPTIARTKTYAGETWSQPNDVPFIASDLHVHGTNTPASHSPCLSSHSEIIPSLPEIIPGGDRTRAADSRNERNES